MGKQRYIEGAQVDKKGQVKSGPTAVQFLDDGLAEGAQLPGGPISAAGDGSVGVQSTRLGGSFVQAAQRRALAAQIGRMQGNRHLRRVVASLKEDRVPAIAPVEAAPVEQGSSMQESVSTFHLSAKVRRMEKPDVPVLDRQHAAPSHLGTAVTDSDGLPGQEESQVVEQEPGMIEEEESDSLNTTDVSYTATSGQGGSSPGSGRFGVTRWRCRVQNVNVTPGEGEYAVTATVRCRVRWQVTAAGGMSGKTNIASANDPAITQDNYTQVATDLMPRTRAPRRSPRRAFWARDLTIRHEQFHTGERVHTYGIPAFRFARTWLGGQTASSEEDVRTKVDELPDKMRESFAASYAPRKEHRAYGDGVAAYQARSREITRRGAAEEYE